jgi:hypothetical protein
MLLEFFSLYITPLLHDDANDRRRRQKGICWVSQKEMESKVNDSAEKAKLNLPNCPKTI